jgi:hypothetical protein
MAEPDSKAPSWSSSDREAAVMKELYEYHEVDPDGDLVLIVGSSSCDADGEGNIDDSVSETPPAKEPAGEGIEASASDGDQEVRIRVSSKHLALASRVFQSMLRPGFLAGDQLRSQGFANLSLPDDNPAAMLILSNLVHGKNRRVPLKVKTSMLLELAILVDKYELLEITETILGSWFKNLKNDIPQGFSEDLLSWICISWVFENEELFEQATKLAQLEGEGPVWLNIYQTNCSIKRFGKLLD